MKEMQGEEFGFERLEVWRKAADFASAVYRITKRFPREELFGLTMQLRRASISVAANIAEGASRFYAKDRARFYEIAYGSLYEMAAMFHIAAGQDLVQDDEHKRIRSEIFDMCRMLSGLRRALPEGGKASNHTPRSTLNTQLTEDPCLSEK